MSQGSTLPQQDPHLGMDETCRGRVFLCSPYNQTSGLVFSPTCPKTPGDEDLS